ncbi:MAG: chromosome segregation ATPase, partial [Cytophagales bacterium]|nr:chromosome segregation ATPase [Cytophaga sp.]
MKKILFHFILLISIHSYGQTKKEILVSPAHTVVEKVDRQGMQVLIELDEKTVTKAWEQKLKEYGKVESGKNSYVIHGAIVAGILNPATIYSTIIEDKKGTIVFWAVDLGSQYVTQGHEHYIHLQNKLHDFAVQTYIADVNAQIATAEGALAASVKNQHKLLKEGESLKKNIQQNKQEKINLENKLKSNESELTSLNNKAALHASNHKASVENNNTEEQQKVLKEAESVRKSIEKNKQEKINLDNKLVENGQDLTKLESDAEDN